MPQKVRFSAEEKLKIVETYLNCQSSASLIQEQYGIGYTTLRDWIRLYKARGIEGLIPATHEEIFTRDKTYGR